MPLATDPDLPSSVRDRLDGVRHIGERSGDREQRLSRFSPERVYEDVWLLREVVIEQREGFPFLVDRLGWIVTGESTKLSFSSLFEDRPRKA